MLGFGKSRTRREEIRKNRLNLVSALESVWSREAAGSLAVAVAFWAVAWSITMLRDPMVRYRPGQFVHQDVLARVEFESRNIERDNELRQQARDAAPRVYRRIDQPLATLERRLLSLPEDVARRSPEQLPKAFNLDGGAITALKRIAENGDDYRLCVKRYIEMLRKEVDQGKLVVLPQDQRAADLQVPDRSMAKAQAPGKAGEFMLMEVGHTFSRRPGDPPTEIQRTAMLNLIGPLANRSFVSPLAASIAGYTVDTIVPTHELDEALTKVEQNEAENLAVVPVRRMIVEKAILAARESVITPSQWRRLYDEQRAYVRDLREKHFGQWAMSHVGMAGIVLLMTMAMGAYMAFYQPRIVQNAARALGLAALLASMLLVAQLAGIGTGPLLIFGVAPTILATVILTIVYDHRFAMGAGSLHGLLVTASLDQGIGFFLIIWMGVMTCGFLLDEVRARVKLVEVGGAAALAMILAACAVGGIAGDPLAIIAQSCLHVGAAGLGVGFVVLGILPFIERTFRVTTGMTLLEVADVSHPLLRRLSIESPGTYAHSLQMATLAEAGADAIGANSLVCRVGAYYHDIGKVHKGEYFCENQFDGQNRHLNLSPSVSMLIIGGHVKDGIELAREYKLPSVLMALIQQHHGTTLVEHFYQQACRQLDPSEDPREISDTEYRYPGPKPKSAEAVILMISDIVEGATRAIVSPTASRVEALVHDLITRRLLDGQFSEADITMGELELVEKAIVKTLLSTYHGRLAYPSTSSMTHGTGGPAVKSA